MNIDLTKFITHNQGPLDLVLDLIPVPVFAKDAQGIYIACNRRSRSLLASLSMS